MYCNTVLPGTSPRAGGPRTSARTHCPCKVSKEESAGQAAGLTQLRGRERMLQTPDARQLVKTKKRKKNCSWSWALAERCPQPPPESNSSFAVCRGEVEPVVGTQNVWVMKSLPHPAASPEPREEKPPTTSQRAG